jgi:hypothetical protein
VFSVATCDLNHWLKRLKPCITSSLPGPPLQPASFEEKVARCRSCRRWQGACGLRKKLFGLFLVTPPAFWGETGKDRFYKFSNPTLYYNGITAHFARIVVAFARSLLYHFFVFFGLVRMC